MWYFWGLKIHSMRALGLMILVVLLIESCGQENCREVAQLKTPVALEIIRTEQELFASESVGDVVSYLEKYPQLAQYFWHNFQYPSDSILAGRIFSQIKHPSVDTVYQESIQAFQKMDEMEAELGKPVITTGQFTKLTNFISVSGIHNIGINWFSKIRAPKNNQVTE